MKQILLLTRNIFLDTEWTNKIQQLGYEVFCSSQLLDSRLLKQNLHIFTLFKTVIFSESVANEEVIKILQAFSTIDIAFFRIENERSAKDSLQSFEEDQQIKFINSAMNLTEIRESLIGPHKESHYDFLGDEGIHHDVAVVIPVPIVAGFITSLSRKEKDLFSILYGRKGEFVSRTELSRVLWKKDASNSTLTQLSQLIGRLKRKMVSFGVDENSVITHWNKGYALSISICNTVTKYIDEKVIQDFVAAN